MPVLSLLTTPGLSELASKPLLFSVLCSAISHTLILLLLRYQEPVLFLGPLHSFHYNSCFWVFLVDKYSLFLLSLPNELHLLLNSIFELRLPSIPMAPIPMSTNIPLGMPLLMKVLKATGPLPLDDYYTSGRADTGLASNSNYNLSLSSLLRILPFLLNPLPEPCFPKCYIFYDTPTHTPTRHQLI